MTDVSLAHLEEVARQAGALVAAARKRGPAWVNEKGMNDFVTETDKACEALILSAWIVAMGVTLVLASRQLAPQPTVQVAPGGPPA